MQMMGTFIKPMHPEGIKFVAIFAAVTCVLFVFSTFLGWIGVGLTVWCYYFFRDPERVTPDRPGLIISPADGVISLIEPAVPPAELGMPDEALTRVSVFMNVFNCHVNRTPVSGEIRAVSYRPGKFFNASLDKASVDNERNSLCVKMDNGQELAVVQIAGLVARRIVCFVEPGATLQRGERFGLIRFGSRLDVYLPKGVEPMVRIGQTMIAGETVLAELPAATEEGA
ncbi:phosphatidylserine decarboxylase [Sulfitobacter mediterraneus]|uniref:phosphatidylserine decarboxylase n=1 Tax=Sulfitobacter mediterraneus TaxID=83219 RepID=UPI0019337E4B|nr:phosphatidylserine decarboxylase [Sulfitobacter mediterraneus]MBM1631661.1 phosphatidylserine decarboxylase [Sulfitobacter mediterraneus]MBM1639476.1 phosphatidylserine decarboxylase [Sulfitobacter mediterraneus]MBM1643525.1 phosphatidylserine decarboxylase [Sulfitobacter mediterraneus]MBM1647571.1 phosphatidylserine decarboxylase [Sulfitobacter mediterraneus]MBM1651616.1 phosphatidylserine decarboxylase [Sulfitobacter mediterraneus]